MRQRNADVGMAAGGQPGQDAGLELPQ